MEPEDPDVLFESGEACTDKDLSRDALPAREKAAQLKPGNVQFMYMLTSGWGATPRQRDAFLLVGFPKGSQDQSVQDYRQLLQCNPEHIPTSEQFGTILSKQRSYVGARQGPEKRLRLDQNPLTGHYRHSLLLARLGKSAESAKDMEVTLQLEVEQKKAGTELSLLDPRRPA